MRILGAKDDLLIEMQGLEKFWSLKSRIVLPRTAIAGIEYDPAVPPKKALALPFFKFPGTVLPGIMFAGTFIKRGERDFWYIHLKNAGVINITTKKGSFYYDRIMFSCTPEIAQDIADWRKQ